MKKSLHIFVFLFSSIVLNAQNEGIAPIVGSINKISNEIKNTTLSAPHQDIETIWKSFGKSSIIGLGEGSHGTSDFFKIKNRIIKYGIEEKGFKLILMEESFSNILKLNDYVKSGNGSAAEALNKFGAWIYQTQEVIEFVLN
jgi:erythromycin esterase